MDVVNSVIQQAINHNYQSQIQQQHLYGQLDSNYHNNLINHIRYNNFQTTKENKKRSRSINKRSSDAFSKNPSTGLQILDFHESWLEEMKSYKNMHVNSSHMLSLHNHVQAAQSYQVDGSSSKKQRKLKPASTSTLASNARRIGRHIRRKDNCNDNGTRSQMGSSSGGIKNLEKEKKVWDNNQVRMVISICFL